MAITVEINKKPGTTFDIKVGEEIKTRVQIAGDIANFGPWIYTFYDRESGRTFHFQEHVRSTVYETTLYLPSGTHHVVVLVESERARRAEHIEITINVERAPTRFYVQITKPEDSYFEYKEDYHEPIEFECHAEGGKEPYQYMWLSVSSSNVSYFYNDLVILSFSRTFSLGGRAHPPRGDVDKSGHLGDPNSSLPPGEHRIIAIAVNEGQNPRLILPYIFAFMRDPSINPNAAFAEKTIHVGVPLEGRLTPYGVFSSKRPAGIPPDFYKPAGPAERAAGGMRAFLGAGAGGIRKSKESAYQPIGQRRLPAVRAGINAGIVQLNKLGPRLAQHLIDNYMRQLKDKEKKWENAKRGWLNAKNDVKKFLRTGAGGGPLGGRALGLMPNFSAGGAAEALEKSLGGSSDESAKILRQKLKFAYDSFTKAEGDVTDFYTKAMNELEDDIRKILEPYAESIARQQARRFGLRKIYVDGAEKDAVDEIKAALNAEIVELSAKLAATGKARMRGIFGVIRRFSMGSQTLSDVYFNLVSQLWEILTGPWVLGMAVFLFEYFFIIMPWSGETPMLTTMIIIGAVGVFLLNFEEVKAPLDWLTHMISGAMIGGGTGLFLLALVKPFVPGWPGDMPGFGPFSGYFLFGIIWFFIALFIGAFQFYQAGGYRVVFQMTILTIVFAYFALGPYNGYYKATMAPVGAVVKTGFLTVRDAFLDVWLLGTNPTEWYARQQLKNVRAEKPLDFPKGIEIEDLVAIPDSVPASEEDLKSEFAVVAVISNRGDMAAKNIAFDLECNEYVDDKCAGFKISDFKRELKPGEGDRVQFTNLFAYTPEKGRAAEFQLAKVKVVVSYEYETSSSLNVEIMSKDEINRRQFAQQNVYRPITAVSKATPAELSLNVGPQPLTAGTKNSRLLVSILNQRSDGTVFLSEGTEITITASKNIISKLSCIGCSSPTETADKITATCTVPKPREIKYSEFKSIFAFSCDIDTQETPISMTDLITAEMPKFIFKMKRSKDIAILPPLRPLESDIVQKGGAASAECDESVVSKSQQEGYNKYKGVVDKAVAENTFPEGVNGHALVAAIITQESGWDPNAIGADGDTGLMQVIPEFHPECGTQEDLLNPEKNILCGTGIIAGQLAHCKNQGLSGEDLIKGALTNYNKGTTGGGCDPTYSYGVNVFAKYQSWQSCIKSAKVEYAWPVKSSSQDISGYCFDEDASESKCGKHHGIDIASVTQNEEVVAIASGTIDFVVSDCAGKSQDCGDGLGNYVKIRHDDGRYSLYSHLNSVSQDVQVGTPIKKGDVIGTVGDTGISDGIHLHFEIHDESDKAINPCTFLDCSKSKIKKCSSIPLYASCY